MPDLKSELKKLEALRFDDEGTTQQEVTMHEPEAPTGVSATFFNVIRDNPGCNRARLVALAETAGVMRASSSSLLSQFATRGLIRTVDSPAGPTYFTVAQGYVKGYVRRAKKTAKVAARKPAPVLAAPKQETNVSELLNNMSIMKARALYDELKQIFGG